MQKHWRNPSVLILWNELFSIAVRILFHSSSGFSHILQIRILFHSLSGFSLILHPDSYSFLIRIQFHPRSDSVSSSFQIRSHPPLFSPSTRISQSNIVIRRRFKVCFNVGPRVDRRKFRISVSKDADTF